MTILKLHIGLFMRFRLFFSEICFLRLDFETFTIVGPTLTTEATGAVCTDTFKVTVSF